MFCYCIPRKLPCSVCIESKHSVSVLHGVMCFFHIGIQFALKVNIQFRYCMELCVFFILARSQLNHCEAVHQKEKSGSLFCGLKRM